MKQRRLILLAITLCLLLAGALALYSAFIPTDQKAVTRMADLGLVLLDAESGVSVLAVMDRSEADRAGIQPGDLLLQADGIDFDNVDQLEELLQATQQQSMHITLQRSTDESMTVQLDLH